MKEITIRATVDCVKGRSDEFEVIERLLDKYIDVLGLDKEERYELVKLIHRQVNVAECDAFKSGFNIGTKLMQDDYEEEME